MTISPLLSLKVKDNLKRVVKEDQSFKKKTWHGLRMVNEVPILVPFLNAEDPVLANSSQSYSLAVEQMKKPLEHVAAGSTAAV